MGRFPSLLLLALALLAGCASKAGEAAQGQGAAIPSSPFIVPESKVSYTAYYAVSDSGSESSKAVWRSGGNARVALGAENVTLLDVFFLGGRAYSCTYVGEAKCYEITGPAGGQQAAELFPLPDFSAAEEVEGVEIGPTRGICYLFPHGVFGKRKMCFTDRGVMAYDEYNVSSGKAHVEYLAYLRYSVREDDFALPSLPQPAPQSPLE